MIPVIVFDMQEMAEFRGTEPSVAVVSEAAPGNRLPEST
jgi:hypothetical protein